jgi:hypothetical protein
VDSKFVLLKKKKKKERVGGVEGGEAVVKDVTLLLRFLGLDYRYEWLCFMVHLKKTVVKNRQRNRFSSSSFSFPLPFYRRTLLSKAPHQ